MTTSDRPRKILPNPFFVLLLLASTAFVVTALMYYVSPIVLQRAIDHPEAAAPSERARAWIAWLDRRGPLMLGIEFVVMTAAAFIAMATDDWFAPKPTPKTAPSPRPTDTEAR